MLGLVDVPSPTVFVALPLLMSIPFAIWKDECGGIVLAAACAAGAATVLYVAFLLFTVGYSPTGISIAASITLVQYGLLCLVAVAAFSWLRRKVRQGH